MAARIAARLRTIVQAPRGGNPRANEDLRVAALDALAPLKDPSVLEMDLRRTLLQDPSSAIRQGRLAQALARSRSGLDRRARFSRAGNPIIS